MKPKLDNEVKKFVVICRRAIQTAQIKSAGPTRTGKRIQLRISYFWKDKLTTGYYIVSYESARKYQNNEAEPFKLLLAEVFRLPQHIEKHIELRNYLDYVFGEVLSELEGEGYMVRTLDFRQEMSRMLRATANEAVTKQSKYEADHCRKHIPAWFRDALKNGITPDELHQMVDEAVVSNVLKA